MTSSEPRTLLGILCICFAGVLFAIMGGFAKTLGAEYSTLQVSWARAFVHLVFLAAVFLPRSGLTVLRSRRPRLQLVRAMTLTGSNLCFFLAVSMIPLAKAAAISLSAPLIVAALAWPMLRERTTPMRIATVVAGFIGVLVVIRPGGELFQPASLLVLGSASFYGVYQILTRRIAPFDSPATSALWSPLVGAVGLLAVLPFVWRTPASLGDLAMFLACGTLGAIGHYFVARAMTYAAANVISPFGYFQLLSSVVVGWLFFDNLPDGGTWIGAAIIVGSGLVLAWDQRRR
ncbi:threonine/homoserine efflux transporter RhtA [Humitalea rosea]|uniref:Threonine/homoserine efflux transporter RhtA n=1 Tax=Humitalea rosea TaxID=990373 RepID=A0A2W7II17_9PROT|nr:DMT family transporter [Humitalea rosea]PZW37619.1 threonine/homoserine efflux transporter RhtA [Humitalea rosea]